MWLQTWRNVKGSCWIKSWSCSVWGGTSTTRLLRSAAWRKTCIALKPSWTAKPTWVGDEASGWFHPTIESSALLTSLFPLFLISAVDLEEALHRSEADKLLSVQRVQLLEEQLQVVRRELADTLEHLQELRDVLQRTQTVADERQNSLEKLTVQLRWGYFPPVNRSSAHRDGGHTPDAHGFNMLQLSRFLYHHLYHNHQQTRRSRGLRGDCSQTRHFLLPLPTFWREIFCFWDEKNVSCMYLFFTQSHVQFLCCFTKWGHAQTAHPLFKKRTQCVFSEHFLLLQLKFFSHNNTLIKVTHPEARCKYSY